MTASMIKCKNCGAEIEVSEALSHQLEEQITASLKSAHEEEIKKTRKVVELELNQKLEKQFASELTSAKKEAQEEKDRGTKLAKQLDELLEEMRALKRRDSDRELEMKKKLAEEEEKIRSEAMKKSDEEHKLKEAEREKIINDLKDALEDAKKKANQGSQQTQGEVLELELENLLRKEFPLDIITEIKKGIRGADILQEVVDRNGRSCGKILWESKNAEWSQTWSGKLREDQRTARADLSVLVSVNLPSGITSFVFKDGVWLSSVSSALALAYALRFNLVQVQQIKIAAASKGETKDELFDYITGMEFRHRVEGMIEAYQNLLDDIEKEKRWFSAKWAKQEKSVRTLLDATGSFHGELESIVGNKLPPLKQFSLEDGQQELIS
jgi:hypothetical protein